MYDVTALGEVLIDFTPGGLSDNGNSLFECNPGGAPANVLATLSKLGMKTAFIGKVGQDQFGVFLTETLRSCGIDTSGLLVTKRIGTTMAFVHLNEQGDRDFSFFRGADILLSPDEVNANLIQNSRIFHFGTISMTHDPAAAATVKALEIAKRNRVIVSFDPNLRRPLWDDMSKAEQMIRFGLSCADIVKLSEEELEFVTGTQDLRKGTEKLWDEFGNKLILVTLGEKGSFYRFGNQTGTVPGYRVRTIDTTGAGDAFLGGFLYQLLQRREMFVGLTAEEMERMMAFANALGALLTTKKGAIPAIPSLQEIRKVMDS